MLTLSPLNLSGLVALAREDALLYGDREQSPSAAARAVSRLRPRAIEAWLCPTCRDVYEDETEAEECCYEPPEPRPLLLDVQRAQRCPVCAEEAGDYEAAANCCLWRDVDAATRWRVAADVQRGSTWIEALQRAGVRLTVAI